MVDVIEIDDSDDEDVPLTKKRQQPIPSTSNGLKNGVQKITNSNSSATNADQESNHSAGEDVKPRPEAQAEIRRKKIDQLMDIYIKYHHRLISVEYMMTPAQAERWRSHLATSYGSLSALGDRRRTNEPQPQAEPQPETGSSHSPEWQRPSWFIDPPGGAPTSRSTYSRARTIKRRAPKKRRKTTRKATTRRVKSSTVASASSVSRKPRSVATAATRPKASTSSGQTSSKERKPKVTKLQSMLAKVKKER